MDVDIYGAHRTPLGGVRPPGLAQGRADRARATYICGTCGGAFATAHQLDAHLERAYHGFQCLACGLVCPTGPAFDEHVRREHG